MQLELSNFQPLAPNEEEAPDLDGAEQPLPPVMNKRPRPCFADTLSRNDINHRHRKACWGASENERLPTIRRGARPSRDRPICRPYRGRFGVGEDHL